MKFTIMYIAHIRSQVFSKVLLLSRVNQLNHREPTQCECNRLLFYSKCTGFTICFTYNDITLSVHINQW